MDSQTLPRLPFLRRSRSSSRSIPVASAVPDSRPGPESTNSGLRPWVSCTALLCALITWSVLAQEKPPVPTESPRDLAGLDLKALMNIEVTSVSRRPERLSDAAASIFVITEDIDRIEVISGPGGTLWGVNAVNGVINIITLSANATRGGLVSA